jgi:hypothetical protein
MTLKQRQKDLVAEFSAIEDWEERYKKIIEAGLENRIGKEVMTIMCSLSFLYAQQNKQSSLFHTIQI